jgi:hypothetical protein
MRKVTILIEVAMVGLALYFAVERPPVDNSLIAAWLIVAVVWVMEVQQRDIIVYLEGDEE